EPGLPSPGGLRHPARLGECLWAGSHRRRDGPPAGARSKHRYARGTSAIVPAAV
ncbi:MAG: hypothetical protein AVDCRST_MAG28-939, partial [uncultured Rubrobacteraceae bacterium]